MSSLKIIKES